MPPFPSRLPSCIVLSAMLLTACSHASPEAGSAAAEKPAIAPWDGMKRDEQRARDIQKMAEQRAAQEQKQIDDDSH